MSKTITEQAHAYATEELARLRSKTADAIAMHVDDLQRGRSDPWGAIAVVQAEARAAGFADAIERIFGMLGAYDTMMSLKKEPT